jgi:hypothetical protein
VVPGNESYGLKRHRGEEDRDLPLRVAVAGLLRDEIRAARRSASIAEQEWLDHDELQRELDAFQPETGGGVGGSGGGGDYRYCRGWFCIG